MTTIALLAQDAENGLGSLYDMVLGGGPMMIPLGVCSVVALAFAVERSIRLRGDLLGTDSDARRIVDLVQEKGAAAGREECGDETPLERVLATALDHSSSPMLEREKAVEDTGSREIKRLSANLQPLVAVAMIAPLLGLLGTVWGMIEAFSSIALRDGLGNPEQLASGISQALVTTAAGLAIAIPCHAAYYWFRGRIDRFVRTTEDAYARVTAELDSRVEGSLEGTVAA